MKMERGILIGDLEQRLWVKAVGSVYRINYAAFFYDQCNINDKILGFVINNLYNPCYNFRVKNKQEIIFGFLIPDVCKSCFLIQTIEDFDLKNLSYDFYVNDYNIGAKMKIDREEIIKVVPPGY